MRKHILKPAGYFFGMAMLFDKAHGRQSQDLFVLVMTNKKFNGTYLEIGGAGPVSWNNTHLLEKEFDWFGVSVEWDQRLANQWAIRNNPCLCLDATKIDYDDLLQKYNLGPNIDYLQLDVDPPAITLSVLKLIDFTKYTFSVVTFEHDYYAGGVKEREESRQIFDSHGYVRVISDMMHNDQKAEDWYIHPDFVPESIWKEYVGDSVKMNPEARDAKYTELFSKL